MLENHLGLLEHQLSYGIIYKNDGEPVRTAGIVYNSAGGPVWTSGTSTGVMKSYIKVLETGLDYWVIY